MWLVSSTITACVVGEFDRSGDPAEKYGPADCVTPSGAHWVSKHGDRLIMTKK